jgi:hypothetical protein
MDNDPKHTSNATQLWLKQNGVNHWKSPPQSPVKYFSFFLVLIFKKNVKLAFNSFEDIMPIENVFHQLKTYIREQKPSTKVGLIKCIGDFWQKKVTPALCRRYINHVVRVLPHVILNNGGATGF